MELRHYSEAISCINEALEYAGDKVPDLYFRRAQIISCNKYSSQQDFDNALNDINKAIQLKDEKKLKEPIYHEFLEKLQNQIEDKKKEQVGNIISKK